MKHICVFTPTYNRAYTLPRLFESLVAQKDYRDFYWLIVDDGSTDNTENLVRSFQDKAPFDIVYIKQENSGKQRAYNTGVNACEAELFICIDSDDQATSGSMQKIWSKWIEVKDDPSIAGFFGVCGKDNNHPYTSYLPNRKSTNIVELYQKHGYPGDIVIVTRTDLLKQYPFKLDKDEKFISENYVFLQISDGYRYVILNEILTIIEYQPDGYSKAARKITRQNPKNYMTIKRMWFDRSKTFKAKMENIVLFLVGAILAQEPHPISIAPSKPMAILCYIPAQILVKTIYKQ